MKKRNVFEVFSVVVSLLLIVDVFLMVLSVNLKWDEMCLAVFGFVLLGISVVTAIYPLLKKTETTIAENILVLVCVALLIAFVIVFSALAEGRFKDAATQVLSSAVGGLLTLYGVGLTIKANRLDKSNDERKKAAPSLYALSEEAWSHLSKNSKFIRQLEVSFDHSTIKEAKKDDLQFGFKEIRLENSGESACVFMGLLVNDDQWLVFQFDNVVPKGLSCGFTIPNSFKESCSIQTVSLVMGDMLGNVYGIPTSFKTEKMGKVTKVEVMGLFAPALLPEEKLVAFGDRGVK